MTDNISTLITAARMTYEQAEITYQSSDINQKLATKPELDRAAELLITLQTKQLQGSIVVTDQDVAEMQSLRDKVNSAATLQSGLMSMAALLLKFV
ncbi:MULTISPECIES: hypothetical protein [Thalassospira]|uniref:Flagellin C-terminal domain-containing protein n=2 Tax=Thalassospira TaxID=168934 RepID=A0A367WC75_9PROT|nr:MULTISPECIES: hypothetical protein [Thalassospira]MDG4717494.1 hypothetical protein [Thalassospira sp. FZY0004]RCK39033.1 hypothetical protein TH19_04395 [Thalassospira profundimaris]